MIATVTTSITERLQQLNDTIESLAAENKRDVSQIRLIAVSKTRSVDEVAQAISAGQVDLGENTIQDALCKIPAFERDRVRWHFIGHLQSNKCNKFAGQFDWLHSVDSLKLLQRLQASLQAVDAMPLDCLLQVNFTAEPSKSGIPPDKVMSMVEAIQQASLDRIRLRGLMTIGLAGDEAQSRKVFSRCRELATSIRQQCGLPAFDQLSMGMSADYAAAIAEGSTMIRLGTAVFGERDYSRVPNRN